MKSQGESVGAKRGRHRQNIQRSLIGAAALAALLPCVPVFASLKGQVIKICREEKANSGKKSTLRESFCKSAKGYYTGKNANTASSAVWTGVATICTTACAKGMDLATCSIANVSGSAANSAITKDFTSALAPLAQEAGSRAVRKTLSKAGENAGTQVAGETAQKIGLSGEQLSACSTAATAGKSSFEQFNAAADKKKQLHQLSTDGSKLDSSNSQAQARFDDGSSNRTESAAATAGSVVGNVPSCEEENLGTASGALRCAMETDPELPRGLASNTFLKDLEKVTGKSADAFFAGFQDPASSLYNSTAAHLSSAQREGLVQSMRDMNREAVAKATAEFRGRSNRGTGEAVAVTAGGHTGADSAPDFDMNGILNQLLGQFGEGEAGALETGTETAALSTAGRKPAIAQVSVEDRNFSLFERVKLRYSAVSQKQHLGETP